MGCPQACASNTRDRSTILSSTTRISRSAGPIDWLRECSTYRRKVRPDRESRETGKRRYRTSCSKSLSGSLTELRIERFLYFEKRSNGSFCTYELKFEHLLNGVAPPSSRRDLFRWARRADLLS